uniref:Uncharacterized protein n=1 Tax=Micrurus carvalhoi TaxID=3147026 RepID=A0A2H6N3T8_9SAUR
MVQLWLLIVYLLLFVMMGDTLTCRNCMSLWALAPCLPLNSFCLTSKGVCGHVQVFGNMRLEKLMLTCLEDEQNKCGSYWEDPKTHFRYKLSCCSDNNLCNWKPFIRPWKYFKSPDNIIQEQENKNSRRILTTKKPTQNSAGSSATI